MIGASPAPPWLYADWLLSQFGNDRADARRRYAQFVLEGVDVASP
jgi:hypothetical protein